MKRRDFLGYALGLPLLSFSACNLNSNRESTLQSFIGWNRRIRGLIITRGYDPVYTSRVFGIHSKALNKAFTSVADLEGDNATLLVASLSARFISCCFPELVNYDDELKHFDKRSVRSRVFELGKVEIENLLKEKATDGADNTSAFDVPKGVSFWHTLEDRPPVRPFWGEVKPLEIGSIDDFMTLSPPSFGSREFLESLKDLRDKTNNLLPEDIDLVLRWADSAGSYTPIGHWNEIFCDLLTEHAKSFADILKFYHLMNAAMLDGGIVCWKYKYKYLLARPSEIDKKIKTRLKVPNFPSYVSGHSVFSSAAANILAEFIPEKAKDLLSMAKDASNSRVLAGIHYDFDCLDGLEIGKAVARTIISKYAN